ncbi:MAG: hypothetical protein WCE68_12465, partial [Anaerolineales bacterium]
MTAEFDLNLFSFYRLQGQEMPQLPGLQVILPPKRAARGRGDEALLVYLTLSGNTRFSSAEYNHIMTQATQRFYQTSGSLTSGIRNAAGELNQFLLNRNLHTTGKGEYIIGRLILGVLRGAQFVFAQCGPTHVFHLAMAENQQIHDEQIAGRGLGIGQTTPLYFAQVDLHAGDLLVLCPNLPTGWEATLLGERNISFETLQCSLLSMPGNDLNVVLAQAQAGKGILNILKGVQPPAGKPVQPPPVAAPVSSANPAQAGPAAVPVQTAHPAPAPSTPGTLGINPVVPARPTSQVVSEHPASRFTKLLAGGTTSVPPTSHADSEAPLQSDGASTASIRQPAQPVRHPAPIPATPIAHSIRLTGRVFFYPTTPR